MLDLALRFWRELPPPPSGAEKAGDKASEILSRAEFRPSRQSLVNRVLDWIGRQLLRAFDTNVTGGSRWISYVIFAAFLALLVFVLSRLRRGALSRPASASPDGTEVIVRDERSAEDWRRDAESLEAAGEWKLALRARYRWLIAQLVDRRVLTDVPGRTPGEYRVELAEAQPDEGSAFAAATDLFELAWYGNVPTGPEENSRFRRHARDVLEHQLHAT